MQKLTSQPVSLDIRDCGLMPYAAALALQLELCARRQADAVGNTVLIVEHPPVITLGARKSENKLKTDARRLAACGIDLLTVGRGGGTTAHNPGQLVLYPILKLKSLNLSVTDYIRSLEGVGIALLAEMGVTADRRKGLPGLWIGEKKIASIGVQIKKWVTFHGMAVNLNNDLSIFEHIIPCGLDGVSITSARHETGRTIDLPAAKTRLAHLCRQHWTTP